MAGAKKPRELVVLDRAARTLTQTDDIEELTAIRDASEAVRVYAKSARRGLEVQNRAAEIRLCAERKVGAILAELRLQGGDRRSKSSRSTLKLDDMGISKGQSARWQKLALVPQTVFHRYVEVANQLGQEITTSDVMRLSKPSSQGSGDRKANNGRKGPEQRRDDDSPHATSEQPRDSEPAFETGQEAAGPERCDDQSAFRRPATVRELADMLVELRNHHVLLSTLLKRRRGTTAGGQAELKRAIDHYLFEVEALLERMATALRACG